MLNLTNIYDIVHDTVRVRPIKILDFIINIFVFLKFKLFRKLFKNKHIVACAYCTHTVLKWKSKCYLCSIL